MRDAATPTNNGDDDRQAPKSAASYARNRVLSLSAVKSAQHGPPAITVAASNSTTPLHTPSSLTSVSSRRDRDDSKYRNILPPSAADSSTSVSHKAESDQHHRPAIQPERREAKASPYAASPRRLPKSVRLILRPNNDEESFRRSQESPRRRSIMDIPSYHLSDELRAKIAQVATDDPEVFNVDIDIDSDKRRAQSSAGRHSSDEPYGTSTPFQRRRALSTAFIQAGGANERRLSSAEPGGRRFSGASLRTVGEHALPRRGNRQSTTTTLYEWHSQHEKQSSLSTDPSGPAKRVTKSIASNLGLDAFALLVEVEDAMAALTMPPVPVPRDDFNRRRSSNDSNQSSTGESSGNFSGSMRHYLQRRSGDYVQAAPTRRKFRLLFLVALFVALIPMFITWALIVPLMFDQHGERARSLTDWHAVNHLKRAVTAICNEMLQRVADSASIVLTCRGDSEKVTLAGCTNGAPNDVWQGAVTRSLRVIGAEVISASDSGRLGAALSVARADELDSGVLIERYSHVGVMLVHHMQRYGPQLRSFVSGHVLLASVRAVLTAALILNEGKSDTLRADLVGTLGAIEQLADGAYRRLPRNWLLHVRRRALIATVTDGQVDDAHGAVGERQAAAAEMLDWSRTYLFALATRYLGFEAVHFRPRFDMDDVAARPGRVGRDVLLALTIVYLVFAPLLLGLLSFYAVWLWRPNKSFGILLRLLVHEVVESDLRNAELYEQRHRANHLMSCLFPMPIAAALRAGAEIEPQVYLDTTILFMEIDKFEDITQHSTANQIVGFLNEYSAIVERLFRLHPLVIHISTTMSSTYMLASGVPVKHDRHAIECCVMALEALELFYDYNVEHLPDQDHARLHLRVGCHSGPIVAAIVGSSTIRYSLFGDTVNTASRMQAYGYPRLAVVSAATKNNLDQLQDVSFVTRYRCRRSVKGKAQYIVMYWLLASDLIAGFRLNIKREKALYSDTVMHTHDDDVCVLFNNAK